MLARAIPFRTVCEHHLLPFSGPAHVGCLPGERIAGLSKLARLVEHFAAGPQVQERLTKQVAECLAARLRARGVGVVLEAEHSCMTLRGVRAHGAKTVTSSTKRFRHSTVSASSSHAAAQMILAAVASCDLQASGALQRVNARGTFVVIRQASLQLRDGGAIVNFSSSAVRLAFPSYVAYAASKNASEAIIPVLARGLSARDITVNAIAPALEGPGAAAADIANLAAFLVSQDGRWVNGQVIRANGVIGSQTQGHGPGISRMRGAARSAAPIRSVSTPGGQDEYH